MSKAILFSKITQKNMWVSRIISLLFLFFSLHGNAQPVANFTVDQDSGCGTPFTASFTDLSTGAVTYQWDFGDGSSYSYIANPVYTYYSSGTFTVTEIVFDGSGYPDTAYYTLVISDPLTASASVGKNISCPNENISFSNYSYNYASFMWDFGDGSTSIYNYTSHAYSSPASYIAKLILYSGTTCPNDTSTYPITISDTIKPPVPYGYVDDTLLCPGKQGNFYLSNNYDYVSYKWHFGDGGTDSSYNTFHAYATSGDYSAWIVGHNGCNFADSFAVNVHVVDTLTNYLSSYDYVVTDTVVCPGSDVSFSFSNISVFPEQVWYFGDGDSAVLANTTHQYAAIGDYPVLLYAKNYCGKRDSAIIMVHVVDTISLDLNMYSYYVSDTTLCPGEKTDFYLYDAYKYSRYTWYLGNGDSSVQTNFSYTYGTSGTYNASLVVFNKCDKSDTVYFTMLVSDTLRPYPAVYAPVQAACEGDSVYFHGSGGEVYTWDFGDGSPLDSSGQEVSHKFPADGNYTVKLAVRNLCGVTDTAYQSISIDSSARPYIASVSVSNEYPCPGDTVHFNPSNKSYASYLWYFGDGTSATGVSPSHVYTASATYAFSLVVTNSCGQTDSLSSNSEQYPRISVDTTNTVTALLGADQDMVCAGTSVAFSNLSTSMYESYWDFGDGVTSTLANPVHVFSVSGSFTVSLIAKNACGKKDTVQKLIVVHDVPVITLSTTNVSCYGNGDGSIGASVSGGATPFTYDWSNASQGTAISSLTTGMYYLTVTDVNGCAGNDSAVITEPTALSVVINKTNISKYGADDGVLSATPNGGTMPYTYNWSTAPVQTAASATALSPGTYTVTITDTNLCTVVATDTLVNPVVHSITGTIFRQNYSDTVKAGEVYLIHFDTTNHVSMDYIDTAQIASNGSYNFSFAEPFKYLLLANADTSVYAYAHTTYFGDTIFWADAAVLDLTSDTTAIDISVKEFPPTTGPGHIHGVVVEGASYQKTTGPGDPLKGITVMIIDNSTNTTVQTDVSDSIGVFEFDDLPYGTYHLYSDVTGVPVDVSVPTTNFTVTPADTVYENVSIYVDSNLVFMSFPAVVKSFRESGKMEIVKLYPNPANEYFTVEIENGNRTPATMFARMMDAKGGMIVLDETAVLAIGTNTVRFSTAQLSNGIYLLELRTENGLMESRPRKIVVVR